MSARRAASDSTSSGSLTRHSLAGFQEVADAGASAGASAAPLRCFGGGVDRGRAWSGTGFEERPRSYHERVRRAAGIGMLVLAVWFALVAAALIILTAMSGGGGAYVKVVALAALVLGLLSAGLGIRGVAFLKRPGN